MMVRITYADTSGAWTDFHAMIKRLIKESSLKKVCEIGAGARTGCKKDHKSVGGGADQVEGVEVRIVRGRRAVGNGGLRGSRQIEAVGVDHHDAGIVDHVPAR